MWHLGSNRALELSDGLRSYRYGRLRKKHQWRDSLCGLLGIHPEPYWLFWLPDLQYIYSLENTLYYTLYVQKKVLNMIIHFSSLRGQASA